MAITCPKCQHENPEGTAFCGKCGASLKAHKEFSKTKTFVSSPKSLQKGAILSGRYKIIEELGRGGMGVVYKAEDIKLKRPVALKFLPPELVHIPEVKTRFMREAQAAAALDHPNICTVHEFDEVDEKPFISMAYIEGQSLKDKLESGWLDLEEALSIAEQVAQGLQEAHKKGIVHRDIKSGNFMVTDSGQAKIMDFGLARKTEGTLLTKEGSTMGTIAYMSPEQAKGEKVDLRTDIWSFGVVLYEMLTGNLPFRGEHEQAVVYSILKEKPEPVTDIKSDIPTSIEQVVSKALEKDPDKRYQKIDELIDDLKSISAGIVPEEIRTRIKKEKLRKRKRTFLYGGAAGLVTAVIILALLFFTGPAEAIDSIAVLPLENLTGDIEKQYFVDGVTDELIGQLGQISGLRRVISRTSVMRYKDTDKSLPEIARELKVDAVIEGTVYHVGDNVSIKLQLFEALPKERSLWTKRYDRPVTDVLMMYGEMARTIAENIQIKLTADETTRIADARQVNPKAYNAYLKGQFHWDKFTEQDIEVALQYYELALKIDPNYAKAYSGIDSYWNAMSYFGMLNREIMPKKRVILDKILELDSTHPELHSILAANAAWFEFDWDRAEREFLLTLELNPNDAHERVFYGLFLTGMGRFEEAIKQMEIGLELDPMNAANQGWFGNAFLRARQFNQAIEQYKKSLALQPDFADSLGGLLECYHKKGMHQQALETARKFFKARGFEDLLEAFNHGNEEGGYKEAMRQAAEAWASQSNRAYSMRIATIYIYAGQNEQAMDWLEIAFQEKMQDLIYLNVQPKWDPLRDDPRFQDLIRQMNFPDSK